MNRIATLLLRKNKTFNSVYSNSKQFFNNGNNYKAFSNESFNLSSITAARNATILGFRSLPKGFYKHSARNMCTVASIPAEKAGLKLLVTGPRAQKMVGIWLFGSAAWVFSMVILGGVTRLTRSGLSMTDWKFTGNLPPLTEDDWLSEFEKYKQSPEYKRINKGMSLEDFKFIYWMEYAHRMWGRALGIMFALPFSYFLRKGYITVGLGLRLSGLFALGAGQGFIGWWMVKSGLEEPESEYSEPRVSPYRLAAHLTSAFAIYCGLLWTALSVVMPEPPAESLAWVNGAKKVKRLVIPVSLIVGVTAISGAFVAGNDAGRAYNTFPKMGDTWIPDDVLSMKPLLRNFFENTSTVQTIAVLFILVFLASRTSILAFQEEHYHTVTIFLQLDHRILATATLVSICSLWWATRKLDIHPAVKFLISSTVGMAGVQCSSGWSIDAFEPYDPAHSYRAQTIFAPS
ncbi:hypothetical protein KSS87_008914 [Heliosperma pusillum]|nr:hypothetical protein KSS87_018112 [Heliosperma pusillum]KAH9620392.1 hypothetical protein KSS87_008914 [Heliosperma pusillum]